MNTICQSFITLISLGSTDRKTLCARVLIPVEKKKYHSLSSGLLLVQWHLIKLYLLNKENVLRGMWQFPIFSPHHPPTKKKKKEVRTHSWTLSYQVIIFWLMSVYTQSMKACSIHAVAESAGGLNPCQDTLVQLMFTPQKVQQLGSEEPPTILESCAPSVVPTTDISPPGRLQGWHCNTLHWLLLCSFLGMWKQNGLLSM